MPNRYLIVLYANWLQNECCGVKGPADWYKIRTKLPAPCCAQSWSAFSAKKDYAECTIQEATKTGCKEVFVQFMKENLIVWISLGFTVTILVQVKKSIFNRTSVDLDHELVSFQFVGILFTCIMYYAFKKQKRELRAAHHSLRYRSNIQEVIRPTAPKDEYY